MRPKVRLKVAGWGISANFVSSVQYIFSAAELRQKNSVLEELEVRMFGQSIRQHGPRRGVDINSYHNCFLLLFAVAALRDQR